MKIQAIVKIVKIYPNGDTNACTKFRRNLFINLGQVLMIPPLGKMNFCWQSIK